MPQSPKTRQQLLELIAAAVGFGASAAEIEPIVLEMEKRGIALVPANQLPENFVNPYAKKD